MLVVWVYILLNLCYYHYYPSPPHSYSNKDGDGAEHKPHRHWTITEETNTTEQSDGSGIINSSTRWYVVGYYGILEIRGCLKITHSVAC